MPYMYLDEKLLTTSNYKTLFIGVALFIAFKKVFTA